MRSFRFLSYYGYTTVDILSDQNNLPFIIFFFLFSRMRNTNVDKKVANNILIQSQNDLLDN